MNMFTLYLQTNECLVKFFLGAQLLYFFFIKTEKGMLSFSKILILGNWTSTWSLGIKFLYRYLDEY